MKKLLEKIYNLEWYKSLPIWYVIMTIFVFSLYKLITIGTEGTPFNDNLILLKISLTLAVPFSLLVNTMQIQMRKNIAFWDRTKVVEKEIDDAETLEELNRILNGEFHSETGVLRKMASGLPHYQKVREMYKVMETKAKYVN
jgi:hypothetical protein